MSAALVNRLRDLFAYNKATGAITNRRERGVGQARRPAGSIAGGVNTALGYVQIRVDGVLHYGHHVAWAIVVGEWPAFQLDHQDCDGTNNRWLNLRPATPKLNAENRRRPLSTNTSGFLGVSPSGKRWKAQIGVGGTRSLGRYVTPEEAHAVYLAAKRRLHEGCTL